MRSFYDSLLSPGDLVFDIGANIGERTAAFRSVGCRVVAVEPQDKCVNVLNRRFGSDPQVSIVQTAVGAHEGMADMFESDSDVLSSLSARWMEQVKASGRFGDATWNRIRQVSLTTLDQLIDAYGEPAFIKIDVEGYESDVLKGLSRPVRSLSFEFTPEAIESAYICIDAVNNLSGYEFNVSYNESLNLAFETYVSGEQIVNVLAGLADNHLLFGDVYARLASA